MNEEGGAGEEPLLLKNGKPFFFLLAFSAEKTDCLLKFLDIFNRI